MKSEMDVMLENMDTVTVTGREMGKTAILNMFERMVGDDKNIENNAAMQWYNDAKGEIRKRIERARV